MAKTPKSKLATRATKSKPRDRPGTLMQKSQFAKPTIPMTATPMRSQEEGNQPMPAHSTSTTVSTPQSDNRTVQSLLRFAGAEGGSHIEQLYLALCGVANPPGEATGANLMINRVLIDTMQERLDRLIQNPRLEFATVIQRHHDWASPAANARIGLNIVKKGGLIFRTLGVHSVSNIKFSILPSMECENQTVVQPEIWTILFGEDIRRTFELELDRINRRRPMPAEFKITWRDIHDEPAGTRHAAAWMFKEGEPSAKRVQERVDELGIARWKKTDRLRTFVRTQLLAMTPIAKLLMESGAGKPIIDGLISGGKHALKQSRTNGAEILHRDEIVHFFAGEIRRLELDMRVPLIMLR